MPTISKNFSIAAGATVENALAASQYEFAPFHGTFEVGLLTTATGVTCSIFSGSDVLQEPGGDVPFLAAGGAPLYPDHYLWEDEVAHGDRLKVQLVNTTAGTLVVRCVARLTPA